MHLSWKHVGLTLSTLFLALSAHTLPVKASDRTEIANAFYEIRSFGQQVRKYRDYLRSSSTLRVNYELSAKQSLRLSLCSMPALGTAITGVVESIPALSGLAIYPTVNTRMKYAVQECTGKSFKGILGHYFTGQVVAALIDFSYQGGDFLIGLEIDDRNFDPNDDNYKFMQETRNCGYIATWAVWDEYIRRPDSSCKKSEVFYEMAVKEAAKRFMENNK